ncbi:hypothetical protein [Brazilian marseillevirus]|uniref:hypothetical protein n=1 Tax=Brazilian marseillevirus TaxID=1813599 RepID=UPI000781B1A4|nr:hypothetical protein A3303_gp465 [Brazilian marseillevirus]AMQ10973.1 hypothetical protein [Brazilian marseillevirus]
MFNYVGRKELVSLAVQDESSLKFLKKEIAREKIAAERIRDFWMKRRVNYSHRDDNFPVAQELQFLKKFTICGLHPPGKYLLARHTDTVNLLRVTGRNVRSCTISDATERKIMKFHLIPSKKKKTFIVELPESLPIILVVYRQVFVEFDADEVICVEQKGEFIDGHSRYHLCIEKYQFKHECSANAIIENGSITYFTV